MLSGKGMYLWITSRVEGGDPNRIADVAQKAGLSHVLIKVADGPLAYNIDKATGKDLVGPVVDALRQRGISPWGWQYIYGRKPEDEAAMAIQRVREFNLDGFVVNAEKEFKEKGMEPVAKQYMSLLRAGIPGTPIGFSSYRYPSMHRPLPFETFLEFSDINMPQVYWQLAYNPAQQLRKSVAEHQALRVYRPILPTGTAYPQGNWGPTAQQVIEFMLTSKELGLRGANFWEWYYARRSANLWEAVSQVDWPVAQPPQDPEPAARKDDEEFRANPELMTHKRYAEMA